MLGISTVWKSQELKDGLELLKSLSSLGINNFELEYRISESTFTGIKKVLEKDNTLSITSIHNYFPIPHESDVGGGDIFLLSSECKEERLLAVKYTIRTIQIAAELGAQAVVVHLGKVPMETVKKELFKLYDNGKIGSSEHQEALSKFTKKREENKGKTFDMLLMSIEALIKAAETVGVKIGIENRYYFSEYPNFDEFGILFKKFGNDKLGYWHDVGHAKVQENLGIVLPNQLLDEYGRFLIGFHLHDVRGYSDHRVPGSGEVDFDFLKRYLKSDALKIIEVHPRESEKELAEGIQFLRDTGWDE